MKKQILMLCATVGVVTASLPAAQASGCSIRADGTKYCSANGGYMDWGNGSGRGGGFPGRQPRDRLGMSNPYGEPGYRLPPSGGGQSGMTCYNIAGKPYTYKGGPRCPIS